MDRRACRPRQHHGVHPAPQSPGRDHQAEITIPYSASSYSIRYRDSQNLGYKNGKIHRNYNKWIHNLDRSIQQELNRASF
nr:hypothetical protein [Pseudomonas oleovorans]